MRHRTERCDLARLIERAPFGGLTERQCPRPRKMQIIAPCDQLQHRRRAQLGARARQRQQFGAAAEEFRRGALIGLHVGGLVADDALVTARQRRQRQRVGCGAVEHEKHFGGIVLEQRANQRAGAFGPGVLAVTGRVADIGGVQGIPGFGADAGGVVAGKLPARSRARVVDFHRSHRLSRFAYARHSCTPWPSTAVPATCRACASPLPANKPIGTAWARPWPRASGCWNTAAAHWTRCRRRSRCWRTIRCSTPGAARY